MKYSLIALAATALTTGASAAHHHRRHNHNNLFAKREQAAHDACTCTTYVTSYVVPVTVYPEDSSPSTVAPVHDTSAPAPSGEDTTTIYQTNYKTSTSLQYVTATDKAPVPSETTIHQPGVYTFPPNTITLTSTGYGVVPTETVLKPGITTYGGVTTVVKTNTVVTCPVVAVETSNGVTVSKVTQTVYECPSAGTYTIGAITTSVPATTTVAYGAPTTYLPGTYVQPELTTTITKTNVVVTCPYTAQKPTAVPTEKPKEEEPSTYAPGPTEEKPTEEKPTEEKPTEEKPTEEKPTEEKSTYAPEPTKEPAPTKEESTYAPPATSPSKAVPKPSSPAKSPGGGKYYGITYSPFNDNGGCKKPEEITSDIERIAGKGFMNVRLYDGHECGGVVEIVASACESHGMGIILGLFIKAGGVDTAKEQLEYLKKWKGWSIVRYFLVGNESIFNGFCTASELASYIKYVREQLSGIYNGPISTTETLNILQANADILCDVMHDVGVNIQPYFDGKVTADKAGEFLASQLKLAEDVCHGQKKALCFEAGWPSAGLSNNLAIASPQDQKTAVLSFEEAAPGLVVYYTDHNDGWKPEGIERNFGCGHLF